MAGRKTRLAFGVVILAAGLALGGFLLRDYLTGTASGEQSLMSGISAACGILWGVLQVIDGLRRRKKPENE